MLSSSEGPSGSRSQSACYRTSNVSINPTETNRHPSQWPYKNISARAHQAVNQRKLHNSLEYCTHPFLTISSTRSADGCIHPLMVDTPFVVWTAWFVLFRPCLPEWKFVKWDERHLTVSKEFLRNWLPVRAKTDIYSMHTLVSAIRIEYQYLTVLVAHRFVSFQPKTKTQ